MSNLIERRRALFVGGRRFLVRGATVEAVCLVESLFQEEIVRCWDAWKDADPPFSIRSKVLEVLPVFLSDARCLSVLECLVESEDDRAEWPVRELARLAVELSAMEVIVGAFEISEKSRSIASAAEVERKILEVARDYGCAPHEVMRWPFAAYAAAVVAARPGGLESPTVAAPDEDMMHLPPGFGYVDRRVAS